MEQIEQRKEKAAELSSGRHANPDYAPKLTPYERKKQCSLCGVVVCTTHITSLFVLSDVRWCKGIYTRQLHGTLKYDPKLDIFFSFLL